MSKNNRKPPLPDSMLPWEEVARSYLQDRFDEVMEMPPSRSLGAMVHIHDFIVSQVNRMQGGHIECSHPETLEASIKHWKVMAEELRFLIASLHIDYASLCAACLQYPHRTIPFAVRSGLLMEIDNLQQLTGSLVSAAIRPKECE